MTFIKQTQSRRALTGKNMLTQPAKYLFFVIFFFLFLKNEFKLKSHHEAVKENKN